MSHADQKTTTKITFPPDFDFKKYEEQGVDISLLTSNLRRSPTERLEGNIEMLKLIEQAQKNLPECLRNVGR